MRHNEQPGPRRAALFVGSRSPRTIQAPRIGLVFVFLLLSTVAFAQVYPNLPELDVVRLVDGTVLKGRITDEVDERYLVIELYGGSSFVLDYAAIESVDTEPNPDYGETWIKVDISDEAASAELSRADEPEEPSSATDDDEIGAAAGPTPEDSLSFLDGGSILSLNTAFTYVTFAGTDFTDSIDEINGEIDSSEQNLVDTLGLSFTYIRPNGFPGIDWLTWGGRTGIALVPKVQHYDAKIDFGSGLEDANYSFRAMLVETPFEAFVGTGNDRLFGYLGGGVGLSYALGEFDAELETPTGDVDASEPSGGGDSRPVQVFLRASAGGFLRLGQSSWVAEARLSYDRMLGSFYDGYEMFYRTFTAGVGVGYHF
jgi:hypothetical protein